MHRVHDRVENRVAFRHRFLFIYKGVCMTILVTGVAGFIGSHVAKSLLESGEFIIGIDNINDYYSTTLKKNRLKELQNFEKFSFIEKDISIPSSLIKAVGNNKIEKVCHLAAQAGVRYSIINPRAYVNSNILGHLEVLEFCRNNEINHLVYASSSSVYGSSSKLPLSLKDKTNFPISLYAATKSADELMSHSYAHLYKIPTTGLRFFTVYGPWGRPDMAIWKFTESIISGNSIQIFNHGRMKRDFTYIDDIVAGVISSLYKPPSNENGSLHRLYNLGNNKPESLAHMIDLIESTLGIKANKQYIEMQKGDVEATYADITESVKELGFKPKIKIEEGIPYFIEWYKGYHNC